MQHLSEFVLNHWILVATFCTLLGVLAANLLMTVGGISTLEAVTLINRESAVVIDVRSVEDFASGHIIDAIHLPLTALAGASDKLKKYASKPLLVYCASGNLAGQAVKALKATGFARVYALKGGLGAWRGDNLPVTTG